MSSPSVISESPNFHLPKPKFDNTQVSLLPLCMLMLFSGMGWILRRLDSNAISRPARSLEGQQEPLEKTSRREAAHMRCPRHLDELADDVLVGVAPVLARVEAELRNHPLAEV